MESFTWKDTEIIAQKFLEKYPDIESISVHDKEFCEKIITLEGFSGPPQPERDLYLFAISRSLRLMLQDTKEEENPHLLGCDEEYLSQYYLKKHEEEEKRRNRK